MTWGFKAPEVSSRKYFVCVQSFDKSFIGSCGEGEIEPDPVFF